MQIGYVRVSAVLATFVRSFYYSPETTGELKNGGIISEGYVGLGCDYTLCGHLPALSDGLSGDCVAVVHDLGLYTVMKKVKGMRVLQWSVGAGVL